MPAAEPCRVLVVGESLVDVLVGPGLAPIETPGGSPLNVAVTLGRLGTPVAILTALGQDERGAALRQHLLESEVLLRSGPVLDRTSSAVAQVASDGTATYEFDISWPRLGSPDLGGARLLHTGSLAFFCSPGAADVGRLLRQAQQAGVVTTLDPNIRPALIGDRVSAVHHLERSLPLIDAVKLSDEDARWLYPDLTGDQVVSRLLERGPRLVALTRGPAGASLRTRDARVDVPAPPTEVVDTVGAGDAWMGALVHGLSQAAEPRHLLDRLEAAALRDLGTLAARVAAATVASQGANPPWADALTQLPPSLPVPTTTS